MLLKGATQLVATPATETVEVAVPGPAWTGQAGSGDVLGGVCAAVLAAGVGARAAAVLGPRAGHDRRALPGADAAAGAGSALRRGDRRAGPGREAGVSPAIDPWTASALIDLDAFVANIEALRADAPGGGDGGGEGGRVRARDGRVRPGGS